jgi:hypothetical protein
VSLNERERAIVESFRGGVEALAGTRLGLSGLHREDRDDGWILVSRWDADRRSWYELSIRPTIPQVRVGIVTEDPERDRDLAKMIEEAGLTVPEFVELAFRRAGLDWPSPPVEHYREAGARYCLTTPLDLQSLEDLSGEAMRGKVLGMLDGYHRCFSGNVTG